LATEALSGYSIYRRYTNKLVYLSIYLAVVATVGCQQRVSPFAVTVSDEMKLFVRACAVCDGQQTKAIGRDEVSSTIPAENESAGALSEEGDEGEGRLQIAEDATSDHDDDDDADGVKTEKGQGGPSVNALPAKHGHDGYIETTTTSTSTTTTSTTTTTVPVVVGADQKMC